MFKPNSQYGANTTKGVRKYLKGGDLIFPINKKGLQSRMVFKAIRVVPPYVEEAFNTPEIVSEIQNYRDAGFTEEDIEFLRENDGFSDKARATQRSEQMRVYEINGEKVELYLPVSFLTADSLDYSNAELGAVGSAVLGTLNRGGGALDAAKDAVSKFVTSFTDIVTGAAGTDAARLAAGRVAGAVNNKAGAAANIAGRSTLNPNLRTTFNSAGIREFNFVFKLVANSPEEAQNIQNIVKFFRFHAYPDEIGGFLGLEYPNMFRIKLQSRGDEQRFKNVGTPLKLCYLKSVATTYNSTSTVLHSDGSPTEVDLNLTFQEYKALNRDDIRYEDDPAFYAYEGVKPEGG